jgi:hypothetical protein
LLWWFGDLPLAVERKYERDIDLLLAEEFAVNPAFAKWFRSNTGFRDRTANVADLFVSKSTNLGESDLIVLFEEEAGRRFALLIEDKVDAPIQPDQAGRYRLRAEKDVRLGLYAEYAVILCAPRFYIESRPDLSVFDHRVSFEEIAAFFLQTEPTVREQYRAQFLATAATRRVNTWTREADETTDAFWEAAYQLATRDFPILEMKRLVVTKGSSWISFRPRDMPTQPKRTYISLKGDRGQIDLTFSNTIAHQFASVVSPWLNPGMAIHQTAASAAIRIETPGFRPDDGFDESLPKLREAFEASQRLIEFYRQHRPDLDQAAREATPL